MAAVRDETAVARDEQVPLEPMMQRFAVEFTYPVWFTVEAFEPHNPTLERAVTQREPEKRHRLLAIVDDGVAAAWPDLVASLTAYLTASDALDLAGPAEVVPGGERCKSDRAVVDHVRSRIHALGIDRHSVVLVVGGGAVQDAVGYAAATAHRGVRVVRMPTTVLAQGDGGVGVKNGVNAFGAKNFVGTFAPPFAVVNDVSLLRTLSARERAGGAAEAVKVALIRDAAFFHWLERTADDVADGSDDAVAALVRRSAELHLAHIASSGDPFEQGSARPLDFGHWAAHRLEMTSGHRLRHGEAVAIGMALDARYSVEAGLLDAAVAERICTLLERLGLALWDPALDDTGSDGRPAVLRGLDEFREHLGGELTVTLLADVGRPLDVHEIDADHVLRALAWLRARGCRR